MASGLVWVDIPVANLDRAVQFYSAVLGAEVKKQDHPGMVLGILPHDGEEGAGGCLFVTDKIKPSQDGPLIYLSVEGRLPEAESAVKANGGKVLQSRHPIDPFGWRVVAVDSEGNRIALHSM